jgi:hypothetical protein
MNQSESLPLGPDIVTASFDETADDNVPPWEEIAPGRYMPRRVRGSCHGRTLG